MSGTTPPTEAQISIATYDRMLAEARKFTIEQNKLAEETLKLGAEAHKFAAEARKFDRERWAVYAAAAGGLIGGTAGLISLLKTAGLL